MSYPNYSRAERIADGIVHVAGVGTAIFGGVMLYQMFSHTLGIGTFAATMIYAAALILMLGASASYHILADTAARPILRRIDHAAIYLKIAGTITPLSVILGTGFAYVILGVVWLLALAGAAGKLMAKRGRISTGWIPYFALGWAGVVLLVPLIGLLPAISLILMGMGGLFYTAGIVFYQWENLRFAMAIWHLFVWIGSGAFFIGISTALAAAGGG